MRKIFILPNMLLFLLALSIASARDIHVDQDYTGTEQDGTTEKPFRSIQQAASIAEAGDTIIVRAGTYRETITPANSGTAAKPIVYMPYQNEEVIISGTRIISGWTLHEGNIYKAPMSADFFINDVNMTDQVFVDKQMMNLARWPNTGFDISYPVKAVTEKFISKTRNDETNITTGVMKDDELPDVDLVGARLYMQPNNGGWSWLFNATISKVEGTTFTFETFSRSGKSNNNDGYHDNSRYYVFNKLSLLDTVGEWFHDKENEELYLWLPGNGMPEDHVIEAKERVYGFNLSEKSYITIKGFTFFACNITTDDQSGGDGEGWNADGTPRYPWRYGIIASSHHVLIDSIACLYPSHSSNMDGHFFFQYGSHSGIVLSGEDHILQNSIIRYSFANGISLLGNRHKIYNNVITDVNYNAGGYAAVGQSTALAYDCEIAYNTIRRTGRSGIRQGFRNSDPSNLIARIHHNVISDFMIQDHDGGGYYHSGNGGFTRVDHNIIHGGKGIMVNGIYPDWAKNYIYHHNVLYNTWSNFWYVKSHKGEGVTNFIAYNNTCVATNNDNFTGDGIYGGPSNFYLFNSEGTNVIKNNIGWVYTPPEAPGYNFLRYFNKAGENIIEHNLRETDPLFVDYPNDLSLMEGSPAIDAAEPIEDIVIDTVTIPAFNDPTVGQMDMGAYEYGLTPFKAGSSLDTFKNRGAVIKIHAAGASEKETMVLMVRSNPVAVFHNIAGDIENDEYATYTYQARGQVTRDQVKVWFPKEGEGSRIRVDKITINSMEYQSEDVYCSCNTEDTEYLDCYGYFHYRVKDQFNINVIAENGQVEINPPGGVYNEGTSVTLTAIPDSGYVFSEWSGDKTGTTPEIIFKVEHNYDITAHFEKTTGVYPRIMTEWDIEVYPNPVTGREIKLKYSELTGIIDITLYTPKGIEVLHEVFQEEKTTLLLPENIKNGFYILRISSGKDVSMFKIMIL